MKIGSLRHSCREIEHDKEFATVGPRVIVRPPLLLGLQPVNASPAMRTLTFRHRAGVNVCGFESQKNFARPMFIEAAWIFISPPSPNVGTLIRGITKSICLNSLERDSLNGANSDQPDYAYVHLWYDTCKIKFVYFPRRRTVRLPRNWYTIEFDSYPDLPGDPDICAL